MSRLLARLAEDWMEDERWWVRWPATLLGFLLLGGGYLLGAMLVFAVLAGVTLLLVYLVRGHL